MKRDMNLIRLQLLESEGGEPKPDLSAYTEEQLMYHSALLIEAGLVHGEIITDDQLVGVMFGFAVGAKRSHLPPTGHLPCHSVGIAPFALGVDRGEDAATVFDALWELHFRAFGFSRFLCQSCVSDTKNLNLLSKIGAHSRT